MKWLVKAAQAMDMSIVSEVRVDHGYSDESSDVQMDVHYRSFLSLFLVIFIVQTVTGI